MFKSIRRAFAAATRVHVQSDGERRYKLERALAKATTRLQRRKLRLALRPVRAKMPDMHGLCVRFGRLEVVGVPRKFSGSKGLR